MNAKPEGTTPQGTAPSLQADLARLEAIVRALEANDLDLDTALALFEEGVGRLREARERLAAAELRLKQLRAAADGGADVDDLEG
ncbi:MAG: exodeoxyribonuclease VII small subunit [Gemmatimonadales bacterium]|nr:exodeoxyribonuclease VII small subunit [Gemmatimonadales bacterium]